MMFTFSTSTLHLTHRLITNNLCRIICLDGWSWNFGKRVLCFLFSLVFVFCRPLQPAFVCYSLFMCLLLILFLYSFLVLFLVSMFPFSVVFVFCRPLHPGVACWCFFFSLIFCLIYCCNVFPSHWCLSLVANHIRLLFVGVFSRQSSSIPTVI